ncbi:hypothetical protein C8R45DRAFT_1022853 [Mycena sanguinolenta]|nr:hypothetical protein C8R45DRAFT_1022853 [Mycena sanguinolenta]
MRLIHRVPLTPEMESFRQLVFEILTRRVEDLLDALPDMELGLSSVYRETFAENT